MLSANFKEFSIILALEIKSDPKPGHSVGYRKFCDFCSLRDNVMGRNKKIILKEITTIKENIKVFMLVK